MSGHDHYHHSPELPHSAGYSDIDFLKETAAFLDNVIPEEDLRKIISHFDSLPRPQLEEQIRAHEGFKAMLERRVAK